MRLTLWLRKHQQSQMQFNLIPPAAIRIRRDVGGWGYARGPYVSLSADTTPHQLPHELTHVAQWWAVTAFCAALLWLAQVAFPSVPLEAMALSIGVHGGLYALSKRYRFWAEVQAYRVSVETSPERAEDFVKMLHNYDTGKTLAQCRAALLHT
tara:strand:- start:724 stop:1182 length:459 start_codon:yes stop_codon:yes gene_type:complete